MDVGSIAKMIFSVAGGLGIFLLGMKNMSEGMQAIAGDRMRKLINAVTNNRLIACCVGIFVTSMIQSSSVTTVMVVGMVNAGLMNLMQAIGVILGADIGTTITAWILALKIGKYGLSIIGASAFFFLFSKRDSVRFTAMLVLGLGMIFFGLELMKNGFAPLKELPEFEAWFSRFSPTSILGVIKCCLAGAILTAIVQSSSATIGITISLASTGVIDYPTAAALVLGENIGTTITAFLASLGTSTNARRAAYAHILIKVIAVSCMIPFFSMYTHFVEIGIEHFTGYAPAAEVVVDGVAKNPHNIEVAIAATHTGFNIILVAAFLPFMGLLSKLLCRLVPEKAHKEVIHLKFLDVRMLDTPAISIQQSKNGILHMGESVRKMLNRLKQIMVENRPDERSEGKIFQREQKLDLVQKEIVEFLSSLLSGSVPHDIVNKGRIQLRMADEYESISDYITNILKLNLKMRKSNLNMNEAARDEILNIHNHVAAYIELITESVKEDNVDILTKAHTRGDAITHLIKDSRAKHLDRVSTGNTSALKSLIFTDMLTSYRKIKDHALNIAEALAGEK